MAWQIERKSQLRGSKQVVKEVYEIEIELFEQHPNGPTYEDSVDISSQSIPVSTARVARGPWATNL